MRVYCRIFALFTNNENIDAMRRIVMILALVCGVSLTSCSSLFMASSLGSNDLYRTDNRVAVANRLKAEAEAKRAEAEAREALWAARQAEAEAERAEEAYYASLGSNSYSSIIANDYESAYARRLRGFNSPTYRMPSSYYNLQYSRDLYYAKAYDPALYNIMVSGDEVWVEPKYITSMFGSWGATNITFGIYASPWNYGWSYRIDPFYYSCWGYPHYSWYDWNWNICYNPWYYNSWYWGYPAYGHYHPHYHYPGHMPPPRPPQHRPNERPTYRPDSRPNHGYVTTGSGASSGPIAGNLNGGRGTTGSRYTSPTSNKNYGTTTITRPTGGTVSTGVNSDSKYRGTTTSTATVNRGTTTTSGSGNFRQSTTSTSRGNTSSSSSSYRPSSSSSNRSYSGSSSSSRSYSGGGSGSSSGGGNTSSRR